MRDWGTDNKKRRQYKTDWAREKYQKDPQHRAKAKRGIKPENRIQPGDGDPRHGKVSSYTNHHCRCDECSAAMSEYSKNRRET